MGLERSFPFDSIEGDRVYNSRDMARVLQRLSNTGYVLGEENELEVTETTPTGMRIYVQTGSAFLNGRYYQAAEQVELEIPEPDDQDRIDRIVIRADTDEEERIAEAHVLKGTPAADPSPPAITRNGDVFEISLAQVYVADDAVEITNSDITDERDDQALCGVSEHPSAAGVRDELDEHVNDTDNPHEVTADQVGAADDPHGNEAHDPDFATADDLDTHTGDTGNPHQVSVEQARQTSNEVMGELMNMLAGEGWIVTTPDGSKQIRIRVNNDGDLVTEEVS